MKSLDKMSLPELRALNEKVNGAIEAAKDREKTALRNELAAMAEKRGFKVGDLFSAKSTMKHSMAPKYRDKQTGATWVGRGRMPRDFDRSRAEQLR